MGHRIRLVHSVLPRRITSGDAAVSTFWVSVCLRVTLLTPLERDLTGGRCTGY